MARLWPRCWKRHAATPHTFVDTFEVVEMWECEWKEIRNESVVKTFLAPASRPRWTMTQQEIIAAVVDGTLFGMVECDVASQKNCKTTFPKCSLCSRTRASLEMTSDRSCVSMQKNTTFSRSHASMLVGSFRGVKILLATPLLRWYLAHGLVVDRVYQIIEYEPNPCFRRFGESVSTARRAGDEDPDKAIIADTMKLLGNSGYGKTVTNVHRHRDVKYCTEIGTSALTQQQTVSTTGCRHRRRVRNRDEQECREVHTTTSHRLLRLPVRQTTHATVLLRLCRQIRRTTAVSVLRDGHRLGIHCTGW